VHIIQFKVAFCELVLIDGIAVEVNANTGDFKKMIFPMDGIITKDDHSDPYSKTKLKMKNC
jgi:hypothetical protein